MQAQLQYMDIKARDGCAAHKLAFYDYGPADATRTVLCVHGLARNATDFHSIASKLASDTIRVMAIDMPGRGESEWLADPMQYHYGNYVADCVKLMDNFHLRKVDFIGTSMGGIIGMMIAATERKRIRRLVLNDIGSFIPKQALARIYTYVTSIPDHFKNYDEATAYFTKNYAGFGIKNADDHQRFVDNSITKENDGTYKLRCDPRIADLLRVSSNDFSEIHDVNLTEFWEKITAPTLIIRGGDSDVLLDYTLSAMKASNVRAESVTFEGVGHAPALLDDAQMAPILRFLQLSGNIPLAVGL
jgi:pimeloyl-ACP methyl ester carboxylesterase